VIRAGGILAPAAHQCSEQVHGVWGGREGGIPSLYWE
jgi:hypothetical protein